MNLNDFGLKMLDPILNFIDPRNINANNFKLAEIILAHHQSQKDLYANLMTVTQYCNLSPCFVQNAIVCLENKVRWCSCQLQQNETSESSYTDQDKTSKPQSEF